MQHYGGPPLPPYEPVFNWRVARASMFGHRTAEIPSALSLRSFGLTCIPARYVAQMHVICTYCFEPYIYLSFYYLLDVWHFSSWVLSLLKCANFEMIHGLTLCIWGPAKWAPLLYDCSGGMRISVKVVSLNIQAGLVGKIIVRKTFSPMQYTIQFEGLSGAWVVLGCTWYACCIMQSHGMVRCVCITERSGKSYRRIFTFDVYQRSFKM